MIVRCLLFRIDSCSTTIHFNSMRKLNIMIYVSNATNTKIARNDGKRKQHQHSRNQNRHIADI